VAISASGRRKEPIHVIPMALALLFAAFAGGALGLVWQSTGLGNGGDADGSADSGPEGGDSP